MKEKSPDDDFLLSLRDTLTDALSDVPAASDYIARIMSMVVGSWGGQQIYVCKLPKWKREQRDRLIHSRFNGHNIKELCHEFNLTDVFIYAIIKRVQKEKQTDLFTEENNHE